MSFTYSLKKYFIQHRDQLGQAGNGIVARDEIDTFQEGSELKNIWGMS